MKEQRITLILRGLGIAPNLSGFEYLKDAILVACEKPGDMMYIYDSVGAIHSKSAACIERACRYAIREGWFYCNPETSHMIFGDYIGVPVVSRFVRGVANYVMYYCREDESNV